MMQKVSAFVCLVATSLLGGCAMCQDAPDHTGPVPSAENFSSFKNSPRVNSAMSGVPAEEVVYESTPEGY